MNLVKSTVGISGPPEATLYEKSLSERSPKPDLRLVATLEPLEVSPSGMETRANDVAHHIAELRVVEA